MIEQVGSYDPMINEHNEYLVALNLERIQYWMGEGANVSKPAADILGKLLFILNALIYEYICSTLHKLNIYLLM